MARSISAGRFWKSLVLLLGTTCGAAIAPAHLLAQDMAFPPVPPPPVAQTAGGVAPATTDGVIVPVGCSSCGGGLLAPPVMGGGGCGPGGCGAGGCNSCCYPGRTGCDCCCDESSGPCHKLLCGLYQCICCPDPCYEPRFVPLANAALFVDPARPITQMRLRGDFAWNLPFPDKAEFFWAKENDKGPKAPAALPSVAVDANGNPIPPGERKINKYQDGWLYNEAAVDKFSLFVEVGYQNIQPESFETISGFTDMNIGTKSLLLDCELAQLTFQFKTYLPTGNFTKGLGVGHVSIEPSLLGALKLTPNCYLQGELAYWIPLGGTEFQGDVFHYAFSVNHLLCHCGQDIQLIGTLECSGFVLTNGEYTDSTGVAFRAVHLGDQCSVGGGLRLSICNKIDFGVGYLYALTANNLIGESYLRTEFRWRF
jgi:hypothetical protein